MGIAAIGFALWSLYDGAIKYPKQRERALAYLALEEEFQGGDPVAFRDRWHELAGQNGWPTSYPGEPKTQGDIYLQYFMAAVAGAVGLWLLWGVWRARGTWIESTESGITSSWDQSLNYDKIVSVDKRKWRSKGIAKVTYTDNGRKRRFIVDDYKFDRHPTGQILRELEARIDPAMITGGPPEAVVADHGPEATDAESKARMTNDE
jgi:hypothetical protein